MRGLLWACYMWIQYVCYNSGEIPHYKLRDTIAMYHDRRNWKKEFPEEE